MAQRGATEGLELITKPASQGAGWPTYFIEALEDTERLLMYAAEVGVEIDDDTRQHILKARSQSAGVASDETTASLLAALTKLTIRLRPVTAESLRACDREQQHAVNGYWKWAVGLAAVIVPFSIASFVTTGFADAIRKDITTANELAVKLATQVQPRAAGEGSAPSTASDPQRDSTVPASILPGVVTDLQQLASITRSVDARARRLNAFVLFIERDPNEEIRGNRSALHDTFQLPADLPMHLREAFDKRIRVYQDVRYFAQNLLDDVSAFYGAIATCLLPVLYALLGTCAYLLRSFEQQTAARTFIPSNANSARFLIAGIGGAVVGLFNNFTVTQGASIPPLAIAFLVGYAVDVFFSFLEGLLQAFTKPKTNVVDPQASR